MFDVRGTLQAEHSKSRQEIINLSGNNTLQLGRYCLAGSYHWTSHYHFPEIHAPISHGYTDIRHRQDEVDLRDGVSDSPQGHAGGFAP